MAGSLFMCRLPNRVVARPLRLQDSSSLFCAVEKNRYRLRKWLVWVDQTNAESDARRFVSAALAQKRRNGGLHAGLFSGERLIGGIGCHEVDQTHRSTSIGYWVDGDFEGQGYMTRVGSAYIGYAFESWGLNRLEVRCSTANMRSRALCVRLGFVEEGVRRQAEKCGDRFHDLVVYGLLAREWKPIHFADVTTND